MILNSIALDDKIESHIVRHESKQDDVGGARAILEFALITQLREISRGLVADYLLSGMHISKIFWWLYYASNLDNNMPIPSGELENDIYNFQQNVAGDAANGVVNRITIDRLSSIKLRIYNKFVNISDEYIINQQLRAVGSSLRFISIGETPFYRISNELLNMLELPTTNPNVDPRFLFGRIGISSLTTAGTNCYQLQKEFAISPYVSLSPGFTDKDRTIIREQIVRYSLNDKKFDSVRYAEELKMRVAIIRFHEEGHLRDKVDPKAGIIPTDTFRPRLEIDELKILPCWSILCDDICRFAVIERSITDFNSIFDEMLGAYCNEKATTKIIKYLLDNNFLYRTSSGNVRCAKYDDMVKWELP